MNKYYYLFGALGILLFWFLYFAVKEANKIGKKKKKHRFA